mgnify:CR=1 FL=1
MTTTRTSKFNAMKPTTMPEIKGTDFLHPCTPEWTKQVILLGPGVAIPTVTRARRERISTRSGAIIVILLVRPLL